MSERQDDRDLKEKLDQQNQPRNPDDTEKQEEEVGFGSAEFVLDADEMAREESDLPENYNDDEQGLIED